MPNRRGFKVAIEGLHLRHLLPYALAALIAAPAAAAPFKPLAGRAVCKSVEGYRTAETPRTFLWRADWLALEKQRVTADPAYAKLLQNRANAALARAPYSVTDKTKRPASGDAHDYYSIGPYWWPDPSKPNGEPYLRRDGEVNPESRDASFDKDRMTKFGADVRMLALAYHYFGNKAYSDHAAKLLRAWFLAPETRMNPDLNYGQAVPGTSNGRGEGIIELNALSPVVEAIGLLEKSGSLNTAELTGLQKWFGDLSDWMVSSPIGKEERAKNNNHGMHYDYLLTQFALFSGREAVAKQVVREFPAQRIGKQIAKDGKLPDELSRTRSWHYSFFALEAATKLATLGECVGENLWTARSPDGKSVGIAFAYLAPYQVSLDKWPHKESGLGDPAKQDGLRRVAMAPFRMMAWGTGEAAYDQLASLHPVKPDVDDDYWLPAMPQLAKK